MSQIPPPQNALRLVGAVPLHDNYKTIAITPTDISILLQALEAVFDALVKNKPHTPTLEHIRDLHNFLNRTLHYDYSHVGSSKKT